MSLNYRFFENFLSGENLKPKVKWFFKPKPKIFVLNWAPGIHKDFCGTKGMCCRYDQVKNENSGCKYGMGIRGKHTCTKRPESYPRTMNDLNTQVQSIIVRPGHDSRVYLCTSN